MLINVEPKPLIEKVWAALSKLPVVCHKKRSATMTVCALRVTGYTYD